MTKETASLDEKADFANDEVRRLSVRRIPAEESSSLWQEIWTVKPVLLYLAIIYCCVINIGVDAAMAGLTLGIPSFRRQFGRYYNDEAGYVIKATYTSAWSGAGVAAQTIGNIISGWVSDKIGRRWALACSCIITIVASIIEITARSIGPLIAGKILMGMGIGFLVAQGPAYLAECSPPKIRGMVVMGVNFFLVVGQWMAAGIIWGSTEGFPDIHDNTPWLLCFGMQFIFATVYLAFMWILPESPVYLVQQGRHDDALKSIQKLFGPKYDAAIHLSNIQAEVSKENEGKQSDTEISYWEPLRGTDLRRTFIATISYVGQVLVGNLFVLSYQNYYYELAGIKNGNMLTFVNYTIAIVGNILSYFLIDTVGRRPLYIFGCFGLGVANFIVGFMSIPQKAHPVIAGNVTIFGLSLWSIVYQSCVGPPAWAINGEIPSNRLRAKTNAWSNLVNALVSFAISYSIPALFNPDAANLGLKMGYIWGSTSGALFIICYFCIPETKGRSSWELDRLFEAKVPAPKFKQAKFSDAGELDLASIGKSTRSGEE